MWTHERLASLAIACVLTSSSFASIKVEFKTTGSFTEFKAPVQTDGGFFVYGQGQERPPATPQERGWAARVS